MNDKLPKPYENAIIYENEKLYVCLANNPIVKGHSVVVWKKDVEDFHLLKEWDYLFLMEKVNKVRNAMLKALKVDKVYLVYMDEAKQVHWHLVPQYDEQGYEIFMNKTREIEDFSLDDKIRKNL